MAIQVINQILTRPLNKPTPYALTTYMGLSTDIKPIDCEEGSTFEEEDTGNIYKFNGINWYLDLESGLSLAPDNKTVYSTDLSFFDVMNYDGKIFTISKTALSVANNGFLDIRIKATTKQVYLEIFYSAEGKAYFKTYLNTTYSANGTQLTPFPRNSGSTFSVQSLVYQAPTVQTLGSARGDDFIGVAGNVQVQAGGNKSTSGTILKPNDDLLIRLQNVAGTTKDLGLIINILEI